MNRKDLATSIWKACDIMRSDGGTSGVLEYMEQLSWMIFLKVFEDVEERFEDEAKFSGKEYSPIIESSFRWTTWAGTDWRGERLIPFIDEELFPYLRELSGTPERERVATIFNEISGNRMKSAYNLKDVIVLLNEIDFNDVEDSHIVSQVYETLLLKLGKEHGIAGEFYTPRPIVRLMVKLVNPEIGDTVFDPFCGSCGFLVESYKSMMESKDLSVEDYEFLQKETFYAQEKKPLPYLIGNMNTILHGLLTPNIIRKNTLEDNIRNIPDSKRHEVILTNPPFGGKENKQIQQNFPIQSQSTEILALQFVMKSLKSKGRCGIVLPEGVLFRGDAFAKVKKELLDNYNLHSIISLPSGAFANVTATGQGPKTNLLFFDRVGKTKEIWYYDFAGYSEDILNKKYSKINVIEDDDLKNCYETWKIKEISKYSWVVPILEIVKNDFDLSAHNPHKKIIPDHVSPKELISNILEKQKDSLEFLNEFNNILDNYLVQNVECSQDRIDLEKMEEIDTEVPYILPGDWKWVKLGNPDVAKIILGQSPPSSTYNIKKIGLPFYQGKADFGKFYPTPRVWCNKPKKIAEKGDVLISVRAPVGPVNICQEKSCVGRGLSAIRPNNNTLRNLFLFYYLKKIENIWVGKGSTFKAIRKRDLINLLVPIPSMDIQDKIVCGIESLLTKIDSAEDINKETTSMFERLVYSILDKAFKGELVN